MGMLSVPRSELAASQALPSGGVFLCPPSRKGFECVSSPAGSFSSSCSVRRLPLPSGSTTLGRCLRPIGCRCRVTAWRSDTSQGITSTTTRTAAASRASLSRHVGFSDLVRRRLSVRLHCNDTATMLESTSYLPISRPGMRAGCRGRISSLNIRSLGLRTRYRTSRSRPVRPEVAWGLAVSNSSACFSSPPLGVDMEDALALSEATEVRTLGVTPVRQLPGPCARPEPLAFAPRSGRYGT